MNFWQEHNFVFVVGILLWPRMLMLFYGLIAPMQYGPIFGLIYVPRMYLMGLLTPVYWETNSVLIAIVWILAAVLDLFALYIKLSAGFNMRRFFLQQQEYGNVFYRS